MNHYLIMGTIGVGDLGGNTNASASYMLVQSLQVLNHSWLHGFGQEAYFPRMALPDYENNKNHNVITISLWYISEKI